MNDSIIEINGGDHEQRTWRGQMSEIVKQHGGLSLRDMDEMQRFAKAAIASQLVGVKSSNKETAFGEIVVKIQYGAELGLGPMQSIQGVAVIQGKPQLTAGAIACLVKRSGKYTYRVTEHTDKVCSITFLENDKECGISSFTIDDAKKAGLMGSSMYSKYPRNMLFARAISNGARWYCPDVFGGSVYSDGELDSVEQSNDGQPIRLINAVIEEPQEE